MSMSVLLVPLAIALCATASETISDIVDKCKNNKGNNTLVQTRINDYDILKKTLEEHGLSVATQDRNHVNVYSQGGNLRYIRENEEATFLIDLDDVKNVNCLVNDLNELENEYDRNVQSFTYNRIIKSLPEDMTIVEDEVLEDDSILLTISVNN
ncbi:MAG: hypothetical protein K5754_10510 [Butyrivibrio sp.]|jgi:hypothetical protein|nr:hypothetical protein [Butyrivibrio sp.]